MSVKERNLTRKLKALYKYYYIADKNGDKDMKEELDFLIYICKRALSSERRHRKKEELNGE